MADRPISLAKARKAKLRAAKRAQGDANAVKFGRSKAEKQADRARAEQDRARHEGHRRDDSDAP